jgi:hypothetical protein
MLIRSARISALAITSCLVVTGCIAPSDPLGPPVGLRVENGSLVTYLPLCPGERVTSAQIDDPAGNGKMLWRAEQPTRPEDKVVQLGGSGWAKQSGSFVYKGQDFSLNISGTSVTYGSSRDRRRLLEDLPPGFYDFDGKKVTAAELDAQARCGKSS